MAPIEKTVSNPERELTLIGHLDELRTRLIIAVGFFVVATGICFFYSMPVLELLIRPATRIHAQAAPAAGAVVPKKLTFIVDPESGAMKVKEPGALKSIAELASFTLEIPKSSDNAGTQTLTIGKGARHGNELIYTHPMDPFMMPFKVALIMGILVSLPVWIWQIWLFVAPGLTDKEKRVVRPMLVGAILLFPLGAAFAYGMLFFVIQLMQQYVVEGIETLYTIKEYLKLMTSMMIVFGFIFELPLIVAVMARVGIVTPAFLRHYRRHIYVGLAAAAMVLTPTTDVFSMLIAFVPLVVLFEISIHVAQIMVLARGADDEVAA